MAVKSAWASGALIAGGAAGAALLAYALLMDTAPQRTIQVGQAQVVVEVVDTPEARAKGLSGREVLPQGRGMLFDMGEDGLHSFWMKDMRFAIDIVWMQKDGTIVYIERGAAPESYPASFAPPAPAYWILEVPAGYMSAVGVGVGDKIVL